MSISNKNLRDVAQIAADIMEGKIKHPNQQKLDVHEPEKDELTAKDFEMLRNKKKMKEEAEEVEELDEAGVRRGLHGEPEFVGIPGPAKGTKPSPKAITKGSDREYYKTGGLGGTTRTTWRKKTTVEEVELDEATPSKNTDIADKSYLKDMGKKPTVKSDLKNLGRFITGKKETNEEIELEEADNKKAPNLPIDNKGIDKHYGGSVVKMGAAAKAAGFSDARIRKTGLDYLNRKEEVEELDEADIEKTATGVKVYGSSYGNSQRARREQTKRPVDDAKGPKMKDLKSIESEKKKKMSEMVATYKEQGLKGLFESLKKDEVIVEEPTNAEFTAQLDDAKQRAAGTKKQAEVSKPAVQAVQNEETHTTVEVLDFDPINGVQRSEIDLEEKTLTEPETKKKEEVVKSMKKGISGFKDRYGDRAKEVMYATATKIAKEKA